MLSQSLANSSGKGAGDIGGEKRKIEEAETTAKKPKTSGSSVQSLMTAWAKPKPSSTTVEANNSTSDSENRNGAEAIKVDIFKGVTDPEAKELLKLESETMDKDWLRALKPEFGKKYFLDLKKFLLAEKKSGKKIFPPEHLIYSWSRYTPFSQVKVVIIGQDPYHNDGQAHGLCFSVPMGVTPPPSLVNIYQAIKKDIPEFQAPKHGYLASWAKQGVLLLNASLTVRAHEPSSHSGKGWETFTDAVIQYLNDKKSGVVFLLWGSHAQKKGKSINTKKHLVLKSVHPSPLSAHRGFLDCGHFAKTNEYLRSRGCKGIDWGSVMKEDGRTRV
ncbi:uncharacterized protein VTP21DRAFT_2395 [Calcarisporiella thermophila]|uniref:uncharacterized protein n=1 Tax=Calcarisporiella thermophila TaxID=911321 RepID=UPI003743D407